MYGKQHQTLLITKNVTKKIKEAIFITVTIGTNISKIFNNQLGKKKALIAFLHVPFYQLDKKTSVKAKYDHAIIINEDTYV